MCGRPRAVSASADGTTLCDDCRAATGLVSPPRIPRGAPAWMRPRPFRHHGTLVSVTLGALGLFGAPFVLYGLAFVDWVTL